MTNSIFNLKSILQFWCKLLTATVLCGLLIGATSCTQQELQANGFASLVKRNSGEEITADTLILGQPAQEWAGQICNLGSLEVLALDGVTQTRLTGVLATVKGRQFDGQQLPPQQMRLPLAFGSGTQANSLPRSYEITPTLPAGYLSVEPKTILAHYDCQDTQPKFAEFKLYRSETPPITEVATP